jgi:hypothetical protein
MTRDLQILGQAHLLLRRFRKFRVDAEEVDNKNCGKKQVTINVVFKIAS